MTLVLIGVAGSVGAVLRFIIDGWVQSRTRSMFPLGTFIINVVGTFVLGFITGLAMYRALPDVPQLVLGTGLCGAFTTFSTFSFETVRLIEAGAFAKAALNGLGSMCFGVLAGGAGLWMASAL